MKRKILNLFDMEAIASSDRPNAAEAAVDNSVEGVCPKCKATMGFARIITGNVYYCGKCRVSAPIAEG